jgi:hypothetical protein
MSQQNFPSAATIVSLADVAARTSTLTGSAIDLRDYVGNAAIMQYSAGGTGTTPTLAGKVQDSDDGSTGWADIAGATFTQVTTSVSTQEITVNCDQVKRFIRYVGTIGGTTPSFTFGVGMLAVKQHTA